ncbi:DOPA-like domain-containing protein [Lasiosphaeria ovina]|uniref:DOPA-like domain-containing protein n=1 Tax=Lasiosphaeria ovina TaxID=92902 RepID=A0AAE0NMV9_9PEZI|nr:DOPA-like domain-containing protein [Lasiosphaeria ovina]
MSDPSSYSYPSPLAGYENAPPLPDDRADDGKSFLNPQTGVLSSAYERFVEPLDNGRRGGFDVHIYYLAHNAEQAAYAAALWERIWREFPELRIYWLFDQLVGPHPVPMFEVNLLSLAQFGAFVPWLAIWRGPLSALIHPNTVEDGVPPAEVAARNHSQRAIWMGERYPIDLGLFRRFGAAQAAAAAAAAAAAPGAGDAAQEAKSLSS